MNLRRFVACGGAGEDSTESTKSYVDENEVINQRLLIWGWQFDFRNAMWICLKTGYATFGCWSHLCPLKWAWLEASNPCVQSIFGSTKIRRLSRLYLKTGREELVSASHGRTLCMMKVSPWPNNGENCAIDSNSQAPSLMKPLSLIEILYIYIHSMYIYKYIHIYTHIVRCMFLIYLYLYISICMFLIYQIISR